MRWGSISEVFNWCHNFRRDNFQVSSRQHSPTYNMHWHQRASTWRAVLQRALSIILVEHNCYSLGPEFFWPSHREEADNRKFALFQCDIHKWNSNMLPWGNFAEAKDTNFDVCKDQQWGTANFSTWWNRDTNLFNSQTVVLLLREGIFRQCCSARWCRL